MTQASLFEAALENIRALVNQTDQESASSIVKKSMGYLAKARSDSYWVGVYLLKGDELFVGPYVGPETEHTRIPVGKGVCGTAVAQNANQIVADVGAISNYLACNIYTKSEIVVLIRDPSSQAILGQIDIDSTVKNAFSKADEQSLERVGKVLAPYLSSLVKAFKQA